MATGNICRRKKKLMKRITLHDPYLIKAAVKIEEQIIAAF
jgi:hypothetical protein